jgi:hypothetical protein
MLTTSISKLDQHQRMTPDPDPIDIALREVTDTKRLLEALVRSSESFDYVRAKATLEQLRVKVRVLGRTQAELTAHRSVGISDRIVPFPVSSEVQTAD